jgi:hypothetical protein
MNAWPVDTTDQGELLEFFGEPGENQTRFTLPFKMKLSWDEEKIIESFFCHKKVHDSLGRIYQNIFELYGLEEIERLRLDIFGGCYSNRNKRSGDNLSLHAFAAALDIDPDRNKLQWNHIKSSLSHDDYEPFWQEFEKEGWVSLGRLRNNDWMHVQAARIA